MPSHRPWRATSIRRHSLCPRPSSGLSPLCQSPCPRLSRDSSAPCPAPWPEPWPCPCRPCPPLFQRPSQLWHRPFLQLSWPGPHWLLVASWWSFFFLNFVTLQEGSSATISVARRASTYFGSLRAHVTPKRTSVN